MTTHQTNEVVSDAATANTNNNHNHNHYNDNDNDDDDSTGSVQSSTATTPTPFLVSPSFFHSPARFVSSSSSSVNLVDLIRRGRKAQIVNTTRTKAFTDADFRKREQQFKLSQLKKSMGRRQANTVKCLRAKCRQINSVMLKEMNATGELRLRCCTCNGWSNAQFCTNEVCEEERYLKNLNTGYYECPVCHARGQRCDNLIYDEFRPMTKEELALVEKRRTKLKCSNKCANAEFIEDADGIACDKCGLIAMMAGGLLVEDVENGAEKREYEEERQEKMEEQARFHESNFRKESFQEMQKNLRYAEQRMARDRVDVWKAEFVSHIREVWLTTLLPFNSPVAQSAALLLAKYSHALGSKTPHRLPKSSALYAAAIYITSTTCASWRQTYTIVFLVNHFMQSYTNAVKSTDTATKELASLTCKISAMSEEINGLYNVIHSSPELVELYGAKEKDFYWEVVNDILNEHINHPLLDLTATIKHRIDNDFKFAQTKDVAGHKPKTVAAALFVEGVGKSEVVIVKASGPNPNKNKKRKCMSLSLAEKIVDVSKLTFSTVQEHLFPERHTFCDLVNTKQKQTDESDTKKKKKKKD